MKIETKFFGEIEIDDHKIITFQSGLLGLTDYKRFTVLYDSEDGNPIISWLQSLEEKEFALPIINPSLILPDYSPVVEDELLKDLGEIKEESLLIFNVVVIPEDVNKMTVNLKAPIIINTDTKFGQQVIAENEDYEIRYPIYEHIKKIKEEKGGE